jgi:hypothetical protein
MHAPVFYHRLTSWLRLHKPMAWFERLLPDYLAWKPDPPVFERLIR